MKEMLNSTFITSYERDIETDLDFAQNRYYNKNLGRFTSADEPFADQFENSPQSWNLYLYVRNNPLNLTDPLGMAAACPEGKKCELDDDGKEYFTNEDGSIEYVDEPPIIIETSVKGDDTKVEDSGSNAMVVGPIIRFIVRFLPRLWRRTPKRVTKAKPAPKPVFKNFKDLFKNGRTPKASELKQYAESQGWKLTQTPNGPAKYVDGNGVARITIKKGSSRAPGSGSPHVEIRNSTGQRVNPQGNPVTRKDPGNHTKIDYDL